jgi:hypothetical protein
MIRRLGVMAMAMGLVLMVAAPAWANDLHQADQLPIASTTASFQGTTDECAAANLQPGQVLWHFLHVGADLPGTLTATFQNAGTQTATGYDNGTNVGYDIITGPDTLLSASDTIVDGNLLNLSHICDGGPPPDVPEAPMSALLLVTAGIAGLGFLGWRMRRSNSAA